METTSARPDPGSRPRSRDRNRLRWQILLPLVALFVPCAVTVEEYLEKNMIHRGMQCEAFWCWRRETTQKAVNETIGRRNRRIVEPLFYCDRHKPGDETLERLLVIPCIAAAPVLLAAIVWLLQKYIRRRLRSGRRTAASAA
ncbi:MAG: hypothetical protein HYY17_10255 [Planctomycetes bacterium]|nr:hypothetical protein [Planctomycetota bacterium]